MLAYGYPRWFRVVLFPFAWFEDHHHVVRGLVVVAWVMAFAALLLD